MQTKTYFASSVPAALEVARRELGAEALLVGSRATPDEARKFGRFEVTFAWDPATSGAETIRHPLTPSQAPASEFDEIRRQLSALRVAVANSPNAPRLHDAIAARLTSAGLDPSIAREIASAATDKPGDPHEIALQELTRRIPAAPFVGMKPGESRTLAFIGPPGRGKTTSLIKLAISRGLACRIPVRIYSAGAHGIGGQEQMARYAAILGTPWRAYESLGALNLALSAETWKGLSLIDTPGISPAEGRELDHLRGFFSSRPETETHLVLRADARSADMLHVVSRFSVLKPSRLLFTGLDEAADRASMTDVLIRCGIPAVFAGTGQRIPEDLEEVDAARLARALWSADERANVEPDKDFTFAMAAA